MRVARAFEGRPLIPRHAPAEEYEAFVRAHLGSRGSGNHSVRAYRNFVEAYPHLSDWFRAPLPERVGRLYVPGSGGRMEPPRGPMTSRVSYLARPYLVYLAMRGYASFDPEWLVAVPRMHPWNLLEHVGLTAAVDGLVREAVSLGYCPESARQGLKWAISRIFMRTADADVGGIGEEEAEELLLAVRAFGERDDLELFYGSRYSYASAMKGYGTHLHLLRVVLYHRGQSAAEPRKKWYVVPERPILEPRMEATVERYLTARRPTSRPNTVFKARAGLRAFALWMAEAYPEVSSFAGVEREHVLEYAADLAGAPHPETGRPLAPTTLRGRISVLSVFFQDTADWGWDDVPGRPLLGFGDLPKIPQTVPRYIPDEELARLMSAVRELSCPFQRAALLVARWSGARRDEIRRLEVDCLDSYPDGTPRLRIPAGKTYQERVVPVAEEAADAIREVRRLREGEPARGFRDQHTGQVTRRLFVHHGKLFANHYLFQTPLKEACLKAGLIDEEGKPTVTAHRFRHTVGTQLAERGAKSQTIMKILGHQSAQMSLVYARISDRAVLEDYRKVLGPGAAIAGPLAATLRAGKLPDAEVEWLKANFFKTELELGRCLRLPQEGPCECDLYLACPKFVTTPEYAPRLRARREKEFTLIDDAISNGWEREVERHRCTLRRIDQLLDDLGETLAEDGKTV
ncbi:MAG: site-specific integrase [Actinomycetota bacterium]|nr:site-specific integrase [Actinomycetota bacterium]